MKKKVIVHTAKKAIEHLDKMKSFHQEVTSRLNINKEKEELSKEPTLEQHMMANNLPPHLSGKVALARSMGMKNYNGSKEHNNMLLAAATAKNINKENSESKKSDQGLKDKEYGLKEKELSLKQQEISNAKIPTSDEIAQSLISKYKSQ